MFDLRSQRGGFALVRIKGIEELGGTVRAQVVLQRRPDVGVGRDDQQPVTRVAHASLPSHGWPTTSMRCTGVWYSQSTLWLRCSNLQPSGWRTNTSS